MNALETQLLETLNKYPKVNHFLCFIFKGADSNMLLALFPNLTEQTLVDTMNSLSTKHFVEFLHIGSNLVFCARDKSEVSKTSLLDSNERLIYSTIKSAGNKGLILFILFIKVFLLYWVDLFGIWVKEIKSKTQMHIQIFNACIKSLEKKVLIKSTKSVKNPTKKLYILAEIEPSTELTGGAWYTDNEFDEEFIDKLSKHCFKFIFSKSFPPKSKSSLFPSTYDGYPTASQVLNFIRKSKITSVDLSLLEINQLLNRLIYDGSIYTYKKQDYDDQEYNSKRKRIHVLSDDENDENEESDFVQFVAIKSMGLESSVTDSPCGKCPVFEFCTIDGSVNPIDCTYFKDWLS